VSQADETPLQAAESAVSESIRRIAERSGSEQLGADDLKKLADGVAAMKHGPQGGDYRYRHEADYHYTQHQGENRDRPPTGFQGG
jgi:hypothetical protein